MELNEIVKRQHSNQLYFSNDEKLSEIQLKYLDDIYEYNQLKPSQQNEKQKILKKCFGRIEDNCYIETPFFSSWGGRNVYFGKEVYANFNLTLIDDTKIIVGDYCLIGPNVTIVTASHTIDPDLRKYKTEYNFPVVLESNVWIGANVVILPNVTIGENSIIGAGSIVTKDIPANSIAVGNPCKILRKINDNDKNFYNKTLKIDL